MTFYIVLSLFLVLVGHAFRLLRWEQFIRIYERPLRGQMLRGMAGGYALNFVLPFHLGDVFRAVFTGRRMKSGIGFALATVIMDRFLDVWFVALGFGAFWALGQGGAAVLGAAQYYLVFSLVLALGLVLVVALRDLLKKGCLAFCGLFNDTLKLDGMMFFWSLINTFKDLGRIKIGRLVVNTVLMWAAYLGSYTALAAALTAAGQPMALVDVFDLLFGRNAADLSALLPGGAMGAAAPAARILLLCWFALPLLAGNLLQQTYNIIDAAIVGQVLGSDALASVGASSSVQFLVLGFCCQSGHPGRPGRGELPQPAAPGRPAGPCGVFKPVFRPAKQRVGQGLPKNEPGHHHFAGLFRRFQRHHHALHGRRKDVLP